MELFMEQFVGLDVVSDAATGPLRFALGCTLHKGFPSVTE